MVQTCRHNGRLGKAVFSEGFGYQSTVRKTWDCAASDIMGGDDSKTTGLTGEEMGESLQRIDRIERSLHQGTEGCGNYSVCGECSTLTANL